VARYLLDSDAVIDHLKGVGPTIALVDTLINGRNILCTCDVVLAEVYTGLPPAARDAAEQFLATLDFLPSVPEIGRQAGLWKYQFARQGTTVALTDALIAATALHWGATVVTGNPRHYPMAEVSLLPLPRPTR
jgi:predicted nucleic acid-binding protein